MEKNDQYFPQIETDRADDKGRPGTTYGDVHTEKPGISVRDKLAESAMIGLINNFTTKELADYPQRCADITAERAYRMADAMIKQSAAK